MFKSLTLYQLTQPLDVVLTAIADKLPNRAYAPCKERDAESVGWIPPVDFEEGLVFDTPTAALICLRADVKNVPASYVKEKVKASIDKRVAAGDDIGPEQEDDIKRALIASLLPGIPPASTKTFAYVDKGLSLLIVGAPSDPADVFMAALGKTLGGHPFKLLETETDPCINFTKWVHTPTILEDRFELGDSCSLKQSREGGVAIVQVQHDDLESAELEAMLEAGKEVCRIGLSNENATFAVIASIGLRALTLTGSSLDNYEAAEDTPARFAIMDRVVRDVITNLEPILGGWPEQKALELVGGEASE